MKRTFRPYATPATAGRRPRRMAGLGISGFLHALKDPLSLNSRRNQESYDEVNELRKGKREFRTFFGGKVNNPWMSRLITSDSTGLEDFSEIRGQMKAFYTLKKVASFSA